MKINSTHNIDKKRLFGVHPFLLNGWLWVFFILLGFADGLAQSPVTQTTAGTYNFTVPPGVKQITVEVWGGGGAGGTNTGNQQRLGGGGGGAYSRSVITVGYNQEFQYVVGAGGVSSNVNGGNSRFYLLSVPGTDLARAVGGTGVAAASTTGGAGGSLSGGVGDVRYSGGTGANGSGSNSGGGGSSAGTGANGVNGSGLTGGIAPSGGGNGGNGVSVSNNGAPGTNPGGGGGGANRSGGGTNYTGGSGAAGKVVITYEVIVSSTNSSITSVTPTKLYADNVSTATITIAVKNAANAAVTNLSAGDFVFSNQGTGTTIEGFQHTGDGIYTFNVRTTTAQTLNMGLTVLGISLGNTGAINFIQPSSSNSTITPSSTSVLANNTSFSTLTIVVRDNNNDVISDLVEGDFEYSGESNATVYDFVNAGGGTYTYKVRNSSAQSVTIAFFVKDFSIGSSAQITFVSPTPNAGTSDVSADPTTVLANGFDFSTITAIVKDADNVPFTSLGFGNFIFGNKGDAIIDENSFVHQGAGVYTFEVANETVETVNISVTAADVNIGSTGNISFINVLPNATHSTVDTDLTTVDANGVDVITLEIDLRDNSNSPITDAILSEFSFTGDSNATIDNFTNLGGGLYEFDIKNTVAETIDVVVTVRTVNIGSTGNLVFAPQVPDAGNSDITRNPTTVNADGNAASTLTITVKDADNIAIQDLLVGDFSFSGEGDAVISDFTHTGSGIYTFLVKNATQETIDIGVTVRSVSLGSSGNITFQLATPNAGNSTIVADPEIILANGTSESNLTITVRDAGNAVITDLLENEFDFTNSGNAVIDNFVNEGAGVYTFTITNSTVETIDISVTVRSVSLGSTGNIAFVAVPNAGNSSVSANPLEVYADASDISLLSILVRDGSNNPITNLNSTNFSFSGQGNSSLSNFVNAGSGNYTYDITNATIETVNIAVSVRGISIGSTGNIDFIANPNASPAIFNTNGTFEVPQGVAQIRVQVWGAGGGGAVASAGGGGGGGSYAEGILNVTPTQEYTITVGSGGAVSTGGGSSGFSGNSFSFTALGGSGNAGTGTAAGGAATGTFTGTYVSTARFAGGTGGAGETGGPGGSRGGGGGGGSATASANGGVGGTGGRDVAGVGGTGTGTGGNGAIGSGVAQNGNAPGGGGGGAGEGGTAGTGATGRVIITFVQVNAVNSILSRSPATVVANGTSASVLTITVRDQNDDPITDLVSGDFGFSNQGSATINNFANTGSGVYTFDVSNNTIETINIGVTVRGVNLGNVGNIEFTSALPSATFSSVDADPVLVANNGTDASVMTLTVKDASNSPVTGLLVGDFEFSGTIGDADITNFTDEGAGIYTFDIANTTVETVNITVTANTVNIGSTGNISFVLLPDATNSSVSATPLSLFANNTAESTLTIDVRDDQDDPITGLLISNFDITGNGSATVSNFTEVGSGIYTFKVKSLVAEVIDISVTVNTINLGSTGNITFLGFPSGTNSSISADPLVLPADGVAASTLTIEVIDAQDVAVTDLVSNDFIFSGDGNAVIDDFVNVGDGVYTFEVTNSTSEVLNIGLTIRTVVIGTTANIEFYSSKTLYSYQSGNWHTAGTWTEDPSGTTQINSAVPGTEDNVVILNGRTVTLTQNVTQTDQTITINSGGVLDLSVYTVQPLVSLSGSGTLRSRNIVSGTPDVAYFPTVTTNNFITGSGGTVVYYQQGNVTLPTNIPTYRHLTIRNTSGSNYTFTQSSDIELFGNLSVDKQSSGTLTFQLGNNTTARTFEIGGNATITSGSVWTVGNFNAEHVVSIGGNLTNNGQVLMQYTDVASYTDAAPTMGRSIVTFTGAADNVIDANGVTRFHKLIVDKGIDQTFVLRVNSTNTANFKILGRNDQAIGTGDNPESEKALFIRNGTLRLRANIEIESLTSGTTDFIINKNAALWIDGATVSTTTIGGGNTALTVIGKFRLSSGNFDTDTSAGVVIRNDAEIIIEGGTLTASQLRPSTTPGLHTASLTISGGTIIVNGQGENSTAFGRLSLPYADNSLTVSGGNITVSTPVDIAGGSISFGMDSGNIDVSGGNWTVIAPDGTLNARISSTAPLYNLTTQKTGTGAGDVRIDTSLEILNDLTVESGVFQATTDFAVTVKGDFNIASGATYTPNNNTTSFTGSLGQSLTIDGTIGSSGLYNMTINKSDTLFVGGAASEVVVRNNFTLSSGHISDGGKTIEVNGASTLSGKHIGTGKLLLNPASNVSIAGNGNGEVANLELSGAESNLIYSLNTPLKINGSLTFVPNGVNDRILNIAGNNLQLSGGVTITGYDENNYIQTNGFSSAFGVSKTFDDELDFEFPIGVSGKYTPASVEFDIAPSAYGTISIRPVNVVHPAIDDEDYALGYYWATTSSGFTLGSATITQTYDYIDTDLGISVVDTDLVPGKFVNSAWVIGASTEVDEVGSTITFDGPSFNTAIDGDFTAADNVNGLPFGELTTYYSRNGGGNWFDNATWSTTGHDGAAAGAFPGAGSIAIIGDGHTVTTNSNGAASAYLQILTGSTLDIGATNGHNFGTFQGASYGTLRIGSSYFPAGDFTTLLNNGTVVYYRIGADYTIPTSSTTKPSLDSYYNLQVEVETGAAGSFIALPDLELDVLNDFRVSGTSTDQQIRISDGSSSSLSVSGDVFVDSGSLRYRFGGTDSRSVTVTGDVTIASGALLGYYESTDVVHSLTISGNLINNGTLDLNSSSTQTVNLNFTSSTNTAFSGTGNNTFARLEVNKGSSQTPKLTLSNSGTKTFPSGGIVLSNGTIEITSDGTLVFSNSGAGYTIPSTSALVVNNADLIVRIGYTADNAADLSLSGKLEVTAGTVEIGNSANDNNNDIVYSSAGSPEIKITGGTLDVNGQIRRSTSSVNGSLVYRQSGSSLVRIRGRSLATSRGMLEVTNTGSIFEMSGSSEIHILRGGAITYQDLYLLAATSTVTGGTIRFRPDGAGNQTYTINTTTPLSTLVVENAGANTASVTQLVNSITVQNNLSLLAGTTLNNSGLDLSIGGRFTKNPSATFTPGNNTVTFIGNDSELDGDFSSNNFYNFTVDASKNLTLLAGAEVRINNTMTLGTGASLTEDAAGNEIDLRGNAIFNGDHISPSLSSTTGLLLNHSSTQNLSGTGSFGNVVNNNSAGISLISNIEITGRLTLNGSGLSLASYLLTLSEDAEISGYNSSKYLVSNGVVSDGGVKKFFPSGAYEFEFPIGVFSKYTPVTYDVLSNGSAGSVTVIPVNVKHPSTRLTNNQQLNYYWSVTTTGFSSLNVTHTYNYLQGDVTGTESNYNTGRFVGTNWTPIGGITGTVNTTTDQMVLTEVAYINGDYTAGSEGEFGGVDVFYSRNGVCDQPTGCNWNDNNSWSPDGHDGFAGISFPNGEPAVINTGHKVFTNGNSRLAESLEINGNAILDLSDNTGHSFGIVSGTGTIRIKATGSNQFVFPGGNYTAFAAETGGNVEFYGTVAGTLPTQTTYNNVFMLENSSREQPDVNWIVNGDFTIEAGSIDNTTYDRNITLYKDWINNSSASAYVPGAGKLILNSASQQQITGTFGTDFGFLELKGGGAKSMEQPIRVQSGVIFDSGNLYLNDHNLTMSQGATVTGTPSSTSMIVINDTGKLRREINSLTSMTFPVGDTAGTANYSPATLTFSSGNFSSAYVEMGVANAADVECGGGNYLNRYWSVELEGITSFAGSGVFSYLQSDVVGDEAEIYTLTRDLNTTSCIQGDIANTVNNTLSLSLTSTGFIITGGDAGELLPPDVQVSDIEFVTVTSSSLTIGWTNGDGTGRIVLAKQADDVDGTPVDNTVYTADTNFSGSPEEIGTDNFVVYTGSGDSFTLTGLNQNTRYYFSVYEYNAIGPKVSYLTTTPPTANQLTKALFELTFDGEKGWRMISLPLDGVTYDDVFDGTGLITQGFTGSTNPSDAPNLLWYDESYVGTDNQRWRQPSNITNSVVPGRGYMYYVFGNIAEDNRYNDSFPIDISLEAFEAELLSSEFNFGVTYTPAADSGWNLVGNPFVDDIDWDANAAWTKTNMMDAIYVWDPSANSGAGTYREWSNGVGDSQLNGIIAEGQSFWVKASGSGPVLEVTKDAITNGANFQGKAVANAEISEETTPTIQLVLSKGQYQKSAYITFNEDSDRGTDNADAFYLQPLSDSYITIHTKSTDNDHLTINSLPRKFNTPIEIPVYIGGFENGQSLDGIYELSVGEMTQIPESWAVEMIDKSTDDKVMWKAGGDQSMSIASNDLLSVKDSDSLSYVNKLDPNRQVYGFEFKYEEPIGLDTPMPGDPIILQSIQGTTQSKFVLRISPNGEFSDIPEEFMLSQNYPNPFNPTTNIQFGLPIQDHVRIDIFDVLGRRVSTVVNDTFNAGIHTVQFNASSLASGVYVIYMQSGQFKQTRKMTLLK